MKKTLLAVGACFPLIWVAHAWAVPSFCTGTTDVVASGTSVPGSFLLNASGGSSGNCVEALDKVFGAFSTSGAVTGAGSSVFLFTMLGADVSIGFQGAVAASSTGTIDYTVAVDPATSAGLLIHDLEKDLTFNDTTGLPATVNLTGTGTSLSGEVLNFACTRTAIPASGTCPETLNLANLTTQLAVVETVTTDANSVVTGLTDTISQALAIPEPSSLMVLATGLLGFGVFARRRHRR